MMTFHYHAATSAAALALGSGFQLMPFNFVSHLIVCFTSHMNVSHGHLNQGMRVSSGHAVTDSLGVLQVRCAAHPADQ